MGVFKIGPGYGGRPLLVNDGLYIPTRQWVSYVDKSDNSTQVGLWDSMLCYMVIAVRKICLLKLQVSRVNRLRSRTLLLWLRGSDLLEFEPVDVNTVCLARNGWSQKLADSFNSVWYTMVFLVRFM